MEVEPEFLDLNADDTDEEDSKSEGKGGAQGERQEEGQHEGHGDGGEGSEEGSNAEAADADNMDVDKQHDETTLKRVGDEKYSQPMKKQHIIDLTGMWQYTR